MNEATAALTHPQVARHQRILLAIAIGFVGVGFAHLRLIAAGPTFIAGDFTWHWRAADALIRGYSPYAVINTMPVYPFTGGYPYFLSTAAVMIPFGYLSPPVAMETFAGIAAALLAYALMRDGLWRLPLMLCAPVLWSTSSGQSSPLVTAAMLVPALGWLAPVKYNLGAVGAAYNLSLRYVAFAVGIVLVSILIWPWWPREWFAELNDVPHRWYHVPVLVPGGILTLLALTRWRRPEARLLAAMACIPQTMLFYDQLPLALLARTRREAMSLAVASYAAPVVALLLYGTAPMERGLLFSRLSYVIVVCYYLPCLVFVLLRKNEGPVPRWLERVAQYLPGWLRGSPLPPLPNVAS